MLDDATRLWEAQGLVCFDAGLVVLQPEFTTRIVKPLVDHWHNDENDGDYSQEVVAQFLESPSSWDNGCHKQLIEAIYNFRASGEFDSSDKSQYLSFLWRDTELDTCHGGQVFLLDACQKRCLHQGGARSLCRRCAVSSSATSRRDEARKMLAQIAPFVPARVETAFRS